MYIYVYTVYIIIVYDWLTLLSLEAKQEEEVSLVQSCFYHRYNCMELQIV